MIDARRQNSAAISHLCFICFATRCLLALLTDVSGGRIKMTRTRLIVGLITSHRTHLTITKIRKGRPRPGQGCSATDDDEIDFKKVSWMGLLYHRHIHYKVLHSFKILFECFYFYFWFEVKTFKTSTQLHTFTFPTPARLQF
jgi:hypothetical protein